MRRLAVSILALFVIAAVSGSTWPALAQEEPPARVGRVSFVAGQLTFHAAGETEWSAAAVNYPVATGGSFWTDPQSRAEIRIGAQTIDLSNDTQIDVTRLNQQVMQIAVPQGRIELRVRALPQGNTVEIDIARGEVRLLQPGIYDIAAGTQDQPSRIAVFGGQCPLCRRPDRSRHQDRRRGGNRRLGHPDRGARTRRPGRLRRMVPLARSSRAACRRAALRLARHDRL